MGSKDGEGITNNGRLVAKRGSRPILPGNLSAKNQIKTINAYNRTFNSERTTNYYCTVFLRNQM
jgi:hypothetical protein